MDETYGEKEVEGPNVSLSAGNVQFFHFESWWEIPFEQRPKSEKTMSICYRGRLEWGVHEIALELFKTTGDCTCMQLQLPGYMSDCMLHMYHNKGSSNSVSVGTPHQDVHAEWSDFCHQCLDQGKLVLWYEGIQGATPCSLSQ